MEKLDLDKILTSFGGWGRFQIFAYVPLCLVVSFSVFQMSYIFTARDVKYRCKISSCHNSSEQYNPEWLLSAAPFDDGVPNRCLHYEPQDNDTCTHFNKDAILKCNDFVFERNQTTIVQDFDITCDENLWKLTIVGSISSIGELFCMPFAGFLSDRFGRKYMIMASVGLSTVCGLLKSFASSYYSYLVLEFLDTALASGMYSGAFILALETLDAKRRSTGNTIICLAFAFGQVSLGLAAWVCHSWRTLLRVIYSPGILILLSLCLAPESVRWLLSKNKIEKAWKILKSAAKMNGMEIDKEALNALSEIDNSKSESEKQTVPFRSVLKSKTLFIRIIHCSFTWICCNFPYYGLTIQSVALSEDLYINFISTALIEVPAYFLTQGTMDKFGRRKTLGVSLLLGGLSCVCVNFAESKNWLSLVIFLSGKFFITVAYTTLYIYTCEMFPTSLRHSIFAVCSMFGRLGSMMAPQVPLLGRLFRSLPLIIFSAMALTSGVLAFWFPETLNTELPDEIDDALNIEENKT